MTTPVRLTSARLETIRELLCTAASNEENDEGNPKHAKAYRDALAWAEQEQAKRVRRKRMTRATR